MCVLARECGTSVNARIRAVAMYECHKIVVCLWILM